MAAQPEPEKVEMENDAETVMVTASASGAAPKAVVEMETVYLLEVKSLDEKRQGGFLASRQLFSLFEQCLASATRSLTVRRKYTATLTTLQLAGEWQKLYHHLQTHIPPLAIGDTFAFALSAKEWAAVAQLSPEERQQMLR